MRHLSNVLFALSFAPFLIGSLVYMRIRVALSDHDKPVPRRLGWMIPIAFAASFAQLIVAASVR